MPLEKDPTGRYYSTGVLAGRLVSSVPESELNAVLPSYSQSPSITSQSITPTSPYELPSAPEEPDYLSALNGALATYNQVTPEETKQTDLQSRFMTSLDRLSQKPAAQLRAEQNVGLPGFKTQLTDITNQLQSLQKEALAIPLQIQQESEGRGVTAAGVAPEQTGRLRQNAIKALSLSAIAQTLQGNITNAQAQADRAVELEFAPEEAKLKTLQLQYQFNKDALERVDKKRADLLSFVLSERTRVLENRKADKATIFNLANTVAKYGYGQMAQDIQAAKTPEEAFQIAAPYLNDPKLKFDMENARLDNILKQKEIDYKAKATRLLGEPTAKEKKETAEALKKAESAIPILQDKVNLIDLLKESPGLKGSVGVYGIARFTPFSPDKAERVNFIAGVQQLVNKETIDTLVNLKERGGTLGALSDQERLLLQQAASKIGFWALEKNGKVYGYEASERDFKAELDTIKRLAQRALQKASGSFFSDDEEDLFSEIETMKNSTRPVIGLDFYQ